MNFFSKKISVSLTEYDRGFYMGSLYEKLKQIATWKDSISLELALFPTVIKDNVSIIGSDSALHLAQTTGSNPFTHTPFSQTDIHAEKALTCRKNDAIGNFLSDLIAFCMKSEQPLDKVFKELKELSVSEKSSRCFDGDLKEIIGALTDSQKACELLRKLSELQTIVEDEGLMPVVVALHSTLYHIEPSVSHNKWEVINKRETEFVKVFLECFTEQTLLSWDQGLAKLLSKEKEDTESGKQLFFLILEIFGQLSNYKKEITEDDLTKTLEAFSESLEARVGALEDCDKGRTIPLLIKARDFPMIQAKMLDIVTTKVKAGTLSLEVELEESLDVSLRSESAVVRVASAKCVLAMLGKDDYCDQVIDLTPGVREMFLNDIFTPQQVLEDDVLNFLDTLLGSAFVGEWSDYSRKAGDWLKSDEAIDQKAAILVISHWSKDEAFREELVCYIGEPLLRTSDPNPELEEPICRFISNMSRRTSDCDKLVDYIEDMAKYLSQEEVFLQDLAIDFFVCMSRNQTVRPHLFNYLDSMRNLLGNDTAKDEKIYEFLLTMCLTKNLGEHEFSCINSILPDVVKDNAFMTHVETVEAPDKQLEVAKHFIRLDDFPSLQTLALKQMLVLIDNNDHRALLRGLVPKIEDLSKVEGELSQHAIPVLARLSEHADSRAWLDKENSGMITFSRDDSEDVLVDKCVFISQVYDAPAMMDRISSQAELLKSLLSDVSLDPSIHIKLLGVLVNLSRNAEVSETLLSSGEEVKRFVFSQNHVLRGHAIEFMANMSVHDTFKEKFFVWMLVQGLVYGRYWGENYRETDFMKNQIRFLLNSIDTKRDNYYKDDLTSKLNGHSSELKGVLASLSDERVVAIAKSLLFKAQKEETEVLKRAVEILEVVCDRQATDDGYEGLYKCSDKLFQSRDTNLRRFGFKVIAKATPIEVQGVYSEIERQNLLVEARKEEAEQAIRHARHRGYMGCLPNDFRDPRSERYYKGYLTYFEYDDPGFELEKCLMFANLTNQICGWEDFIKQEACQIHYMGSKLTHENDTIKRSAVQFLSNMSKLSGKRGVLRMYMRDMRAFSEDPHDGTRGYAEAFLENMEVPVKRKAGEVAGSDPGPSKKPRGGGSAEHNPGKRDGDNLEERQSKQRKV